MQVFAVTGLCFPHKDRLKALGFKWWRESKAWVIPVEGTPERAVRSVVETMSRCTLDRRELPDAVAADLFRRRTVAAAVVAEVEPAPAPAAPVASIAADLARVQAAMESVNSMTDAEVAATPPAPVETARAIATDRVREQIAALKATAVKMLQLAETLEREIA